jgi:hypothetical protein
MLAVVEHRRWHNMPMGVAIIELERRLVACDAAARRTEER